MKFLTLVVAALTFAGAAAVAQPVIGAEKKAAVREMLLAMDFKRQLSQVTRQMGGQMPQMIEKMFADRAGGTALPPETQEKMRSSMKKLMDGSMQRMATIYDDPVVVAGMEDIMTRAYGQNFATDEIRAITSFYGTSAGKKLLETQPAIMQQSMPEIFALIGPRVKEASDAAMKEMRAEIESVVPKK